ARPSGIIGIAHVAASSRRMAVVPPAGPPTRSEPREEPPMQAGAHEAIELAYRGHVYTILAIPMGARCWSAVCSELGIVQGHYPTARDAILGGLHLVLQYRTRRADLAA